MSDAMMADEQCELTRGGREPWKQNQMRYENITTTDGGPHCRWCLAVAIAILELLPCWTEMQRHTAAGYYSPIGIVYVGLSDSATYPYLQVISRNNFTTHLTSSTSMSYSLTYKSKTSKILQSNMMIPNNFSSKYGKSDSWIKASSVKSSSSAPLIPPVPTWSAPVCLAKIASANLFAPRIPPRAQSTTGYKQTSVNKDVTQTQNRADQMLLQYRWNMELRGRQVL